MEILEDPEFKTMYQKYKIRVKLWESRFTQKHGRKPNKNDIKEADMKIKESYKMYWKLKTRALEETLTDITFDDEVKDNVPNKDAMDISAEEIKDHSKPLRDDNKQAVEVACERNKKDPDTIGQKDMDGIQKRPMDNIVEKNIECTDEKDAENIDPQELKGQTNLAATDEHEIKNVKGVWGEHLSKSNEQVPKTKQILVGRSSSFQLSQTKFTGANFTKRNPRKSLSMSKIKTKQQKDAGIDTPVPENMTKTETSPKDDIDVNEETKPIFGDPVKVTYIETKANTQSLATVQQLIEGHTVNRNLNPGWLDRCAKQNNLEYPAFDPKRLSGTSDSGIESMESSIHSPKENLPMSETSTAPSLSDEEDFVCNSDTEEDQKNKRIRNFKKRLSDQETHPSKRLCVASDGNLPVAYKIAVQPTSIKETIPNEQNTNGEELKTVIKNNDTKGDLHPKTNLSSTDKCNDKTTTVQETTGKDVPDEDEENTEKSGKKRTVTQRKVRRRIKQIPSDNSDPDFDEAEAEEKKDKRKATRTKRAGTTRKSKTTAGSTSKSQKKPESKARRTRKKKDAQGDEDDLDADTANAEAVDDKGAAIYGIETLKTVPRFAMNKAGQGDLIQQFTKSVSLKSDAAGTSAAGGKATGKLSDKERLEKKIADGKVNENFVRINLKKKVFVRGKKNFNFSKYKKNQWKQRKKELGSSEGSLVVADFVEKNGSLTCFKCGDVGHFSRRCPNSKGDDLIPLDEVDESSMFPTLEEAQKMASENALAAHANRIDRLPQKPSYIAEENEKSEEHETDDNADDDLWEPIDNDEILCGHKIPEELVQKLLPPEISVVQPLYKYDENTETPADVLETLHKFGHQAFRPGQEKAVMRILSGQSTLVTLSTGSGKSLCYQLPAYLYARHSNCITLVISPLVSLMDDQVTGVPSFLSAACLHTNQTQKVRDNVMDMVKRRKLDILLISPEAVVAGEKSTGFGALLRQLPPIAFACIDEAHCISQWSHNFRPSYLMVCRVLREKLGVRTVLGLTATATKANAESIVSHLGIQDGMAGVISDIPMPRNLLLSVSKDEHRDQALVELLQSERFQECNSIIVYCTRREECARIAGVLRVNLQETTGDAIGSKVNSKISPIAEVYHAGLSAHRRKVVQKAFMGGQTRIIVATVAFGMGLNKPDIRAVIHYNMPGTFEGYVQEVGRAGRDGLLAQCHLFLSRTEDSDKWELRRHIYANGVDRHTIRRLLQKVFVPCSCSKLREKDGNRRCPGHEVAIPVDETVAALDISEETIATLLCYLELHPKRFITVLSSVYVRARVSSYSGAQALKQAAQSSPPLAMAIALDLQRGISHENDSVIEFPVVDVASAIGWDSGVVKSHLKSLEWKTVNGASKRSSISVRYDKLGLRVRAPGDLTDAELDEALDALVSRAQNQETSALQQLETIGVTLHQFSTPTIKQCLKLTDEIVEKSDQLKGVIRRYFSGEVLLELDPKRQLEVENEAQVAADVRNLIVSYRDNNFTGRAVARIFHGIQSPNYPAYIWNKCRFWRAHLSCNFNALCHIATREILALR